MKIPFFNTIPNASEKGGIRLNRRVVTFLFCLLASAFFWVTMSLSKDYTIELSFPVSYVNRPSDKVISNNLPETIDIDVRSSGFNLLIYKFKRKKEPVLIDIKGSKPLRIKNHYYLLTNSRIDKVTSQFDDIKVVKIYPDTLFLNFSKKISKTVPVKANLKLDFDKLYQQTDSIKLNPNHIKISGAADLIDKIKYVETEPVYLKNITDSLSLKLRILKTPDLKMMDLSQSSVQATVNVTKFTEATIELPIEVENLPSGYVLKLFPDKVSIKYSVAFQNYEKINALQFRVVVDYLKMEPGSNKLKVQLLKYPSEIRSVKMNPEKVEYIIRK
ncbi:MAG: CdaR family protein [Bacteroidota bacterium]